MIRAFGGVTTQDIQNEVRAVAKLCKPPTHKNIVSVQRYGRIPIGTYYFLDMECCDVNLEDYIRRKWSAEMVKKMPYFTNELPSRMRMTQIWGVMEDVTSGLAFIHSQGEVHRDLKPRNGIVLAFSLLTTFSSLFSS